MTTIESIQKRFKSWDYKGLPDALADMRVLLEEIRWLKDENARLITERRSE